jgi:hypothetical protein
MIVASPIYLQSWPMLSQPAYVEMPQAYRQWRGQHLWLRARKSIYILESIRLTHNQI